MEWAAARRAPKVVNMSLGGGADRRHRPAEPGRQRADRARPARCSSSPPATTGRRRTPSARPARPTAALTVGAVDRGRRRWPSSPAAARGSATTRIKPDITAPGVDIVAARAAGTAMGTPVDDALHRARAAPRWPTPHVAGAAALLAQQHPDWTGRRSSRTRWSAPRTTRRPDRVRAGRRPGRRGPRRDPGRLRHRHRLAWAASPRAVRADDRADHLDQHHRPGRRAGPRARRHEAERRRAAAGALTLGADSVTVPAGSTATVPADRGPCPARPRPVRRTAGCDRRRRHRAHHVGVLMAPPTHEVTFARSTSTGSRSRRRR